MRKFKCKLSTNKLGSDVSFEFSVPYDWSDYEINEELASVIWDHINVEMVEIEYVK